MTVGISFVAKGVQRLCFITIPIPDDPRGHALATQRDLVGRRRIGRAFEWGGERLGAALGVGGKLVRSRFRYSDPEIASAGLCELQVQG